MDTALLKHYHQIRAEHPAMPARQVILWARSRQRVDAIDWAEVSSPPPTRWYHWCSIGWEEGDGTSVRVDTTDDEFDHDDATTADSWPIHERADWNRRAGMARGPAWAEAVAGHARDKEREHERRSALIRVVVTLPNGAEGNEVLGGWDYLESTPYTRLWRDVLNTVLGEGMLETARRDAEQSTLPRQYHRAS